MNLTAKKLKKSHEYAKFEKLNGDHPFKKAVPGAFVEYGARVRKGGELRYFNYDLAKEMGLIPGDHPAKMNKSLEDTIMQTFAFLIINEYDIQNNKKFPESEILPRKYMATRYLQLQHADKKGLTSGDGRSVWNGQIKHKNKIWDVSSCGTGATCLSPATSKFGRYFETGDPTISYGCGYAELDEGFGTAIFSQVMKRNNIQTEETLCIIEFEKGISINIRAHQNLLRPSHFFNHLKQGNQLSLKKVMDYYIEIEKSKPEWKKCPEGAKKYEFFLKRVMETFAKMAARFESEYIFCWLDWDGDNILMDGGIIDYGSIRQFGLFHSEYRYDDVDRFSTNILEQKNKAKYIVQSFIQAEDFVRTGKKKKIEEFKNHKLLDEFEVIFEEVKNKDLLTKLGFGPVMVNYLLEKHLDTVLEFRKVFYYFERSKSKRGMIKVGDGISWDAIFCMRDLMREMPQIYLSRGGILLEEEFIEILRSDYAQKNDLEINAHRKKMIADYQNYYKELIAFVCKKFNLKENKVLLEMSMRSSVINKAERVTGDSVTHVVDKVLSKKPFFKVDEIYDLITEFANFQTFNTSEYQKMHIQDKPRAGKHFVVLKKLFEIVREHREGI